jgi:hypothetical protein
MNKGQQGNLDAVEMMRSIRDELSRKLKDMTHEEQRRYIKEQLASPEADQKKESRQRSIV